MQQKRSVTTKITLEKSPKSQVTSLAAQWARIILRSAIKWAKVSKNRGFWELPFFFENSSRILPNMRPGQPLGCKYSWVQVKKALFDRGSGVKIMKPKAGSLSLMCWENYWKLKTKITRGAARPRCAAWNIRHSRNRVRERCKSLLTPVLLKEGISGY